MCAEPVVLKNHTEINTVLVHINPVSSFSLSGPWVMSPKFLLFLLTFLFPMLHSFFIVLFSSFTRHYSSFSPQLPMGRSFCSYPPHLFPTQSFFTYIPDFFLRQFLFFLYTYSAFSFTTALGLLMIASLDNTKYCILESCVTAYSSQVLPKMLWIPLLSFHFFHCSWGWENFFAQRFSTMPNSLSGREQKNGIWNVFRNVEIPLIQTCLKFSVIHSYQPN